MGLFGVGSGEKEWEPLPYVTSELRRGDLHLTMDFLCHLRGQRFVVFNELNEQNVTQRGQASTVRDVSDI